MENLDIRLLSVENEALLRCNFRLIVVSIFLKTSVKDHGDTLQPITRKKDLISIYRGALVCGLLNISDYYNNNNNNNNFIKI